MIIISVDLGLARTGLAYCDKGELLASPLCVIEERELDVLAEKIAQKVNEVRAELIVVGLPKNMDGSEGESAVRAREFADKLHQLTGLECVMQDERGTTVTATGYLNNTNTRGKKRKKIIDSVAATIILEDYMRKRRLSSM